MPDDKLSDVLGKQESDKIPVKDQPEVGQSIFTAEEYVTHVKYMEMISLRASDPIRQSWDRSWGLYNGQYDFTSKASWQSKNFIPRVNMTVRSATFMVKKSMLGPGKPFTVEGVGNFGKLIAFYMDRLTTHHLEEGKYVTKVADSLHAGLLSSLMVLKVYPVYVNEESIYWSNDPTPKPVLNVNSPIQKRQYKKLKMCLDPVDPYDVHLDPTGQNKFIIHDIEMDLYDLMDIAQEKSYGYDLEQIKLIQEDYTKDCVTQPTEKSEYRTGEMPDTKDKRRARTVFVQEYWGDVWTTDGKLVARNCTFAIANKKYLIKKPTYNTLPDRLPPFIVAPVVRKPFSVWHQSFTEMVSGIQIMMTELVNLILDANLFQSAKAFELDIDLVYDPLEFIQGIAPGKTYKKRGGGFNNSPMIKEVQIGSVAQQSLLIYQMLDREFGNGTGLNEFAMPSNPSRSRTTATEVMEKSNSAANFMEEIANTLEETVIEPLCDKYFHNIAEYQMTFDDPHTLELFGAEEASKLSIFMKDKVFRDAIHKAPFKFKARGLSATMSKMRELEKLAQLSKILQPYPELLKQVDPKKIMNKILESMGWYPQDILSEFGNQPPLPLPSMASSPMPNMPISSVGDLGFLGDMRNGQSQMSPMSIGG